MIATASLEDLSQAGGRFKAGTHAVQMGRLGGSRSSPAKTKAARRNAKKKRPRKGRWPLVNGRQDWRTPPALFAELEQEYGPFDLDAAASAENALCPRFFDEQADRLAQSWAPSTVWCNPPYSPAVLGFWIEKAYREPLAGATVVMLIPVRSDATWWHEFVTRAEVAFLKGRVRFFHPTGAPERRSRWPGQDPADVVSSSAPFPSAVVIFRPPAAEQQGAA